MKFLKLVSCCSLTILATVVPSFAESPEERIYSRLDNVLQAVSRNATLKNIVPDKGAFTLKGTCGLDDPTGKNYNLPQRAEWSRQASQCASTLARVLDWEAARATGQASLDSAMYATKLKAVTDAADVNSIERDAQKKFLGYDWGMGFGASYSFDDVIDDAVLVNGIVRANKEKTLQPRAVLEFHRFFTLKQNTKNGVTVTRGHGPFAAVTATSDDLLAGFGLGYMIGWKDNKQPADTSAFTVGLGIMLDGDVKALADGIEEDQPLPANEPAIRFKEESRASVILVVTRSF